MKLLIVGGVAGGANVAGRARRLSENAEIIVLERGPYVSFANCGLPYYLGGEIEDRKKLLLHTPETLKARFNLDVRVLNEAVKIDRTARTVQIRRIETNEVYTETYDQLVLATGAAPIVPNLPGVELPGVFTLRDLADTDKIYSYLTERGAKRAAIIGGGFIGLEMVEQFAQRGLSVTLVERMPQVMMPLDPELASLLHDELSQNHIEHYLSCSLEAITNRSGGGLVLQLSGGMQIEADLVILSVGVKPENTLAREAGLELGVGGAVKVNQYLQTSDPRIWAVGDSIEVTHGVTGKNTIIPLAGPANRQGRIVADNLLGKKRAFKGSIGTSILRLFSLTAGATGANEKLLTDQGVSFRTVHLHPGSHAGYYPGAQPIAMKLLFSKENRRVLGAQAVGKDGIDKRIDVIATAIIGGMTVDDLAELELSYSPPFGSAKDPVNIAGMAAQNICDGYVETATPSFLLLPGEKILDVRDEGERAKGAIPDSLHIPLSSLRSRLAELPRETPLLVYCQSGQRSYYACRILSQHGYTVRNLSGAFKSWKAAQG